MENVPGGWSMCGGYQPWMDEYVPDAHHLIMISNPYERLASMYYYERGFTKQKDGAPGDESTSRINSDAARFMDPTGVDQPFIHKWLTQEFFVKWERVQWWWIRDYTANKTVEEAIALLRDRFVVGLVHRFDESLLIWKRQLRLPLRDFIFTSMKAGLTHPKFAQWGEADQARGRLLISETGDAQYFAAAEAQFADQVKAYGEAQLQQDATAFRLLIHTLQSHCAQHLVLTEVLHVPDQVYCMLEHYDAAYERLVGAGTPLGCFTDVHTADHSDRLRQKLMSRQMTQSQCAVRCAREEATHFALYASHHCFCGAQPPDPQLRVPDARCNAPCGGNTAAACGSAEAYLVFALPDRSAPDYTDAIIAHTEIRPVAREPS